MDGVGKDQGEEEQAGGGCDTLVAFAACEQWGSGHEECRHGTNLMAAATAGQAKVAVARAAVARAAVGMAAVARAAVATAGQAGAMPWAMGMEERGLQRAEGPREAGRSSQQQQCYLQHVSNENQNLAAGLASIFPAALTLKYCKHEPVHTAAVLPCRHSRVRRPIRGRPLPVGDLCKALTPKDRLPLCGQAYGHTAVR